MNIRSTPRARGFSAVELLVVVGILLVLVSIFVPYLLKIRETDHRVKCADNLRLIFAGLSQYASTRRGEYPRVIFDSVRHPNGFVSFTGADGGDPFAKNSSVQPNDVTASLWLLVRLKLVEPRAFICPSTNDEADPIAEGDGLTSGLELRGNFRGPENLSYSYACPFSSATKYGLNDTQRADFALLADENPGIGAGSDVTAVPDPGPHGSERDRLQFAKANSRNHAGAGQNVLFADSHVEFSATPYCGVADAKHPELHDNIFTALASKPLDTTQAYPPINSVGLIGTNISPAWESDSYLVPFAANVNARRTTVATTSATTSSTMAATTTATAATTSTSPPTTSAASRPAAIPATTQAITRPTTTPTTSIAK